MTPHISSASKRILIADDDPVTRLLIASTIKPAGYTAVEATDGREAYRILRSDADFKAAILDMAMPHINGVDLIRHMRTEKRLKRIPVMIITAEDDLKVMTESFSAGAIAYLPKPFTPQQLQKVLRMLLADHTWNEIAA